MSKASAVIVCPDPGESYWQLGEPPAPPAGLTLIGWREEPRPVDGGVPAVVAEIIAGALTNSMRVTFLHADLQSPLDATDWQSAAAPGEFVRALPRGRLAARIMARLKRQPEAFLLCCTRDRNTAVRLFDSPDWCLQGQVALLSSAESRPPNLDFEVVAALLGDGWARQVSELHSEGVCGALRPGVDGDVAGLLTVTPGLHEALLTYLERATRAAGWNWQVLPETQFADFLAD